MSVGAVAVEILFLLAVAAWLYHIVGTIGEQ